MKKLFSVLFFFLLLSSVISETVHIVSLDSYPFISESLPGLGAHAVIVRRAFELTGYEADFRLYPWARAVSIAEQGEAFLMSASFTEERDLLYNFSDAYYQNDVHFIGLSDSFNSDVPINELTGNIIGVIRQYFAVDYLEKNGFSNIELVNSKEQAVKMLEYSRIDLVVMGEKSFLAEVERLDKNQLGDFVIIEPEIIENSLHLIGSKKMPRSAYIIYQFNRGLAILQSSGEYSQILREYGLK